MSTGWRLVFAMLFVLGATSLARAGELIVVVLPDWCIRPSMYVRESRPYFAENPPIYYTATMFKRFEVGAHSDRQADTTSQVVRTTVVRNNHCDSEGGALAPAVRPLRISNPFVAGEE